MGDALACLEFSSIARGLRTLDTIAKRAPVHLRHHSRHSGPKYIILFDGAVAPVEESYEEALAESRGGITGHMLLSTVHPDLWQLLEGEVSEPDNDRALMFVELTSVALAIETLDFVLKLVDAQFASGISGRAYYALQADLSDIEYAANELRLVVPESALDGLEVVTRPHSDLFAALGQSEVFKPQR